MPKLPIPSFLKSNAPYFFTIKILNHAIEIYTVKFTWQKSNYIHKNLVAAKIVVNEQDYFHSSARDYYNLPSLVKVECLTPPLATSSDYNFFRT
jgi:hypothetical protein